MKKREFTLKSAYDNLEIACAEYQPDGVTQGKGAEGAKGVVQLVHGMCEYKERYEPFVRFLIGNGYIVFSHDHRGHGNSVKSAEDLGYFGDKKGEAIVDDTALVTDEIRRSYPDLPLTLFGHSMGSLVVRAYLKKYEEKIDKLVVCGSPSKNALAGAGIALNGVISALKGERHRSALMAKLSTGGGDEEFPGEGKNAWLTREKSVVEKYNADEKCNFVFTCNGFSNLLHLVKNVYKKKNYPVKNPDLPVFFIAGGDDPVIINAKKWLAALEFLKKAGYKNVSGKLYEGMRHEILNERGKEEVYNDVLDFLRK
ncbi:MAG: alpha/beta hydrolase [Candidatus Borkfalkiaceae bacterium]|nr:alpha/beta hydrolase [Clostridia bacterium]MDY6223270.1 alpha/beta hydrolase [Christensenellaceae bacterium]